MTVYSCVYILHSYINYCKAQYIQTQSTCTTLQKHTRTHTRTHIHTHRSTSYSVTAHQSHA